MRASLRLLWLLAAVSGAAAVALGAYGSHGLEAELLAMAPRHLTVAEWAAEVARRRGWWETAVQYHLAHSLAAAIACLVAELARRAGGRGARFAALATTLFVLGAGLFAGTLYAMALGGPRVLGAVTPLGGGALIVGWLALGLGGLRAVSSAPPAESPPSIVD